MVVFAGRRVSSFSVRLLFGPRPQAHHVVVVGGSRVYLGPGDAKTCVSLSPYDRNMLMCQNFSIILSSESFRNQDFVEFFPSDDRVRG